MSEELFAQMRQAVADGDAAAAAALAEQALANNVPPLDAIDKGFVPGLTIVGEQFGLGELFLPDMMLAARAMQKAVAILEPVMKEQAAERHVLYLDFEDNPAAIAARRLALGVEPAAIVARFHYVRPEAAPEESALRRLAAGPYALAVIDAPMCLYHAAVLVDERDGHVVADGRPVARILDHATR